MGKRTDSSLHERILLLIFGSIVIFFTACPKTPAENFQSQLNVFSVIRSDAAQQVVRIDRTYAMEDTTDYDLQYAFATITGDTFCDTLDYVNWRNFVSDLYLPVEPQHTYKIMVAADGLDTLRGETTVPGVFTVIFPQDGDTVFNDDTILIRKSLGGKVYEFRLYQNDTLPSMVASFPDFLSDSLFRFPVSELFLGSGDWRLQIAAYDSNYFNYQYKYDDEYPQCGVQGGLGAFCSAYVNSVNFFYQP
jgi:hypothetical protein